MYWQDGSLRNIFGSLWKIVGSLQTSSDMIRALRKILALSGEKCHAYKLKKVGRYILEQAVFLKTILETVDIQD